MNINQISSFAFKNNCSFIGGKPYNNVLSGDMGIIYFFFNPRFRYNFFYQWVRSNFDSSQYSETTLIYKHSAYSVISLKIPQIIDKKFLLNFKAFSKSNKNLVNYF